MLLAANLPRSVLLPALGLLLVAACARGGGTPQNRGGGGGGGGGGVITPPQAQNPPFLPGIVAIAPLADRARIDVRLPTTGHEAALFTATSRDQVYAGAPAAAPVADSSVIVTGLASGERFFGLAVRATGATTWSPTGLILRATLAAPIYVDAAANATGADGLTPATAFPDLRSGVITAAIQQRNVLVRDGVYETSAVDLAPGVGIYGGFDAGFDLAERDVAARATIVRGLAAQPILNGRLGSPAFVLDGLALDGARRVTIGLDLLDSSAELRSVDVVDCTDRGVRVRNASTSSTERIRMSSANLLRNGADGISFAGAFEIEIDGSAFDANVQEGLECDDLVALEGRTASLHLYGSRFSGNGSEGVDADLNTRVAPTTPGGVFDVDVRGCRFELNGLDGILVDLEYELQPTWRADVVIRESQARNNGRAGFHVDADSTSTMFLHRLLASGNSTDGIWISSETNAGFAVLSSCLSTGNVGAGARASLGNKPVFASHCVFAGNQGFGLISSVVASTAASSIGYAQVNPWQGTTPFGSVSGDDGAAFTAVPRGYEQVVSRSDATLTLARAFPFGSDSVVELADDRVARTLSAVSGATVTLTVAPAAARVPTVLNVFANGASVLEDWRLPTSSPHRGQGLRVPGAAAVDPGVYGAPQATGAGITDDVVTTTLQPAAATPPTHAPIARTANVEVSFSRAIDPSSLSNQVRVVDGSGNTIAAGVSASAERITLTPPGGSWSTAFFVELHRGLRAIDGTPLTSPLVLAYLVQP